VFLFPMLAGAQPWSMPNMTEVCKVIECKEFSIKEKVALAFQDEPIMVDVAYCESRHTQLVNGKPLISRTSDVGVMQINQVHWKEAKSLGLDIFYNEDDNIKMGRIVYDKQGVKAWTCYNIVSRTST